ncbi:MAG: hypothetical protein BRD23_07165, partial [Halobacteriales archaeon SW_9_67_25]
MTASRSRALRTVGLTVMVVTVLVAGIGMLSGTAAGETPAPDCTGVSYDGGDGTADSPYEVTNVSQLQCSGANHSDASSLSDALGSNYTLVSDIDANDTSSWNGGDGFDPIGNSSDKFAGTFDGDGYNITGLRIANGSANDVGLFGVVGSAGSIENVGLEDANVTGNGNVGGLV